MALPNRLENPLLKKNTELHSRLSQVCISTTTKKELCAGSTQNKNDLKRHKLKGPNLPPLKTLSGSLFNDKLSTSLVKKKRDDTLHLRTETLPSYTKVQPKLFSTNLQLKTNLTLLGLSKRTNADRSLKTELSSDVPKKKKRSIDEERKIFSDIEVPVYNVSVEDKEQVISQIRSSSKQPVFSEKKEDNETAQARKEKANMKKVSLINVVSVALLRSPKLDDLKDETRKHLMALLNEMSEIDPEFILKLALYTRKHLNVRVVANFLLAYAAYVTSARPFLTKYFCKSIVLPSDWISVAEIYQTFFDKSIHFGSLPVALRKAMVAKFPDFDEYQLAKYNKDKVKTKVVTVKTCVTSDADVMDLEEDTDFNREEVMPEEQYILKSLTLKQLIRKLHINEPVYHVMCLLGKKYPEDMESFYKSRLPGIFNEEKAGKRMKLQTPETWETQVSLKGNRSATWEDLIDHNKLPFMAMLRNLRNMLLAGVKPSYHSKVANKLSNEQSVINSKQFPFRFLSAFEVLEDLEPLLNNDSDHVQVQAKYQSKIRSKPVIHNAFKKADLRKYQKALNKALMISTIHNIPPIPGSTIIIIDVTEGTNLCCSAKAITQKRTILEMCLLLGLMCKFHCEDSQLIVYDNNRDKYMVIEELGDCSMLLNNVKELKEKVEAMMNETLSCCTNIMSYLNKSLAERQKFNNILVLGYNRMEKFDSFVKMYRKEVNPTFLNVQLVVGGNMRDTCMSSNYDVCIGGFSDQILCYIAERGSGGQLTYVENIDVAYDLVDIKVKTEPKLNKVAVVERIERPVMPWKTVQVFISSTFKDMHGERDLLTRYVFPELRCWCYNYCINVYEVDLRWGITEKQSQSSDQLEICLNEIMKSDLFVGLIGNRYGWIPENYNVSDGLDWLKNRKPGCSITELEMRGFLQKPDNETKAFFYFRDQSFVRNVPKQCRADFKTKSAETERKLCILKDWLKDSDIEIFNDYPCRWGGVNNGKPMVAGLEEFGQRVLNNLWNAIKKHFIHAKESAVTSVMEAADKHLEFAVDLSSKFVGRKTLIIKSLSMLQDIQNKSNKNIILVTGKSGSGKTAFMSKLFTSYNDNKMKAQMFCYFAEADNKTLTVFLKYIFTKLNTTFDVGFVVPETYRDLKHQFEELIKSISKQLNGEQFVVLIDGLDQMECSTQKALTEWIPEVLPKGFCLVLSCLENTVCQKLLATHQQLYDVIKVGAFELIDRADFVRQILSQYGKELDESAFNNQMKLLLSKRESNSPLFLKMACEELRMFGVFEKLTSHLRSLAQTVPLLVEFSLQRMEVEIDKQLVANVFATLYYCRQGLKQEELFAVLNMLHNFMPLNMQTACNVGSKCFYDTYYSLQQVPRTFFLKLCHAIKMFIDYGNDEQGLMKLQFNDIINIIEKRYIRAADFDFAARIHIVLSGFYRKQADPFNNCEWKGNDRKALIEFPYHLMASGVLWQELLSVICSTDFIKAKVEANMCMQLLEDFQMDVSFASRQHQKEKEKLLNSRAIVETKDFIGKNLHILSKYPQLLMQQAVNSAEGSYMNTISKTFTDDQLQNVIRWVNKPSEQSACLLTISNLQQAVTCISLSKDEAVIACGMDDGLLYLYDKNTAKVIKSFCGHAKAITSCCFAGSSKLCSASEDGKISVWDVHGGHRLHLISKHKRQVSCCKVTNDGKILVSVSWDNTAKLWTLSDGKDAGQLAAFNIHPLNCVAFDKNEKHVAIGGWNKEIIIWNVLENSKTDVYKGHKSAVRALAYSPSGRHLASAGLRGEILLWCIVESKTNQKGVLVGQMSSKNLPLTTLTYSPSGRELIAGSTDTSIKIWAGSLGCPIKRDIGIRFKSTEVYPLALAVCDDGTVVTGYNNGAVSTTTKEGHSYEWKAHQSAVRSVVTKQFMHDQHQDVYDIVTGSDDYSVKNWRWNTSKCEYKPISVMKGHSGPIRCVRSKNAFIISASEDSTVRIWDSVYFNDNVETQDVGIVLRGHSGIITCCDLSSCETMAISGAVDQTLIIWDLLDHVALCTIYDAHADGLTTCCWSDVGNYIVTGSNDFSLKLWDTKYLIANVDGSENLKEKVKFIGHTNAINDVKYKFGCIVSVSVDGSVKVWTRKGVEITTIEQHKSRINCCDIWVPRKEEEDQSSWYTSHDEVSIQQKIQTNKPENLDDVIVFTASDDGSIQSCRPFKPNLLHALYGHSLTVMDAVTCNKTPELITCSLDKTVKVWNFKISGKTGDSISHSGEVSCLAYFDEHRCASGGRDGYVHLYESKKSGDVDTAITVRSANVDAAVAAIGFYSRNQILSGDVSGMLQLLSFYLDTIQEQHMIRFAQPIQDLAVFEYASKTHVAIATYASFSILNIHDPKKCVELTAFDIQYGIVDIAVHNNYLMTIDAFHHFHKLPLQEFCKLEVWYKRSLLKQKISEKDVLKMAFTKETVSSSEVIKVCSVQSTFSSRMFVFIGNTDGTVSWKDCDAESSHVTKQVHDSAVIGLLLFKNQNPRYWTLMATASKDCTVKIWVLSGYRHDDIKQVALFYSRAPITTLAGHVTDFKVNLIVGETNGDIEFLNFDLNNV